MQATEGFSITVSDDEILSGQALLAKKTGIFAEPSAAAGVSALSKIRESELTSRKEQVVLLITGHGLKDVQSPLKTLQIPEAIKPDMEALANIADEIK